ncbi:MAG: DUF2778 domain-containing protein [Phyllobacterium sp.]|uniref:DUF2778 domain-containing protein n=1 Tax=Phyllobacterium sp. TaxID=1871046 RepID=UPI0030EFED9F
MAFVVETGVKPAQKNGRRRGPRLTSTALLASFGVMTAFGAIILATTLHHAVISRAEGTSIAANDRLGERAYGLNRISLATNLASVSRQPKYPRVPELTNTSWQVSDMDEGSVISATGEIIVITPPKPKIVVAAKSPLEEDAFGARASGLDTMRVASVRSYSTFDEPPSPQVALAGAPAAAGYPTDGPFSLVLAEADPSLDDAEDSTAIPLPGIRPNRPAGLAKRAAPQLLAYAPQDNNLRDIAPSYEPPATRLFARNRTAIYDISAKTVYMPNGDRLEAHSGLGSLRDNPRYVHKKMRGATPPHTYRLTMREALFHGVEAIRLNPVDSSKLFGRDGLLAHTYMLGPRGDSNGCVSFKDYRRFLAAFKRGEVTQLVVVARMPSSTTSVASR